MQLGNAKREADLAQQGVVVVRRYLNDELAPRIRELDAVSQKDGALVGFFLRVAAALQGLSRLDHPVDFQLALAGNRMVLESLVDAILISSDALSDGLRRLEYWELSAKLKAAEATVQYISRKRGETGPPEQPLVEFIEEHKERLEASRLELWPIRGKPGKGKHPNRWTGRDLLSDIREADRLQGTELEEYYEIEYRRMNWNVHGSSLVGVRGLEFKILAVWFALAQRKLSEFALILADLTIRHVLGDEAALREGMSQVKRKWQLAVVGR